MSFLFPAFLLGIVTVAIPIILHLVRRDVAPRVAFSDIRFLRRAPMMQARRRRLRELLLLALRMAALMLLVLAFARPFFGAVDTLDRSMTLVLLDRSFSMSSPGLFERARALARDVIDDASGGRLVGVVAFDDTADVYHEPTTDRGAAVAALDLVAPGAGATRYASGLEVAVELIGSREGRIVVVTDLQRSGWDVDGQVEVPSNVSVEVRDVGPGGDNLVVTALQPDSRGAVGVAFNAGSTERSTTVVLRVDGAVVESVPLILNPGATDVVFDAALPTTGMLELALEDLDGPSVDDRRFYLLDPPDLVPLAVVTNGGRLQVEALYLERALLAGGESSPFTVLPVRPRALSERPFDDQAAVLLAGTEGLDRSGRRWLARFVESGGGLLIVAGSTLDPALVTDVLGQGASLSLASSDREAAVSLTVTDPRHPVFRAFGDLVGTLGQVRFHRTMRLDETETDAFRVLARFTDGTPALVEYGVGRGRAMVFTSDLNNDWNDFPRRPTFVPFVHEVTQYLVGQREHQRDLLIADAPPGVVPEPGLRTIPGSERRIVLNVDPRESEPPRVTPEAFRSRIDQTTTASVTADASQSDAAAREAEQGYWWYVLVAMVGVLVAEAWLGRTMA